MGGTGKKEKGETEPPQDGAQSSSVWALAGGFEKISGAQKLTVTLKVTAFCRPSGETCSSSATAWISRALTTEATSCASVYVKYQQDDVVRHMS